MNDDGHDDLIVANSDSASVFLGQGSGTFANALPTAAGHPNAIAVGDFNNDGRPDLVAANYDPNIGQSSSQIIVLLGRGDGTYYAQSAPVNVGNLPSSIVAADFNGDGNLDLAVTSQFEGTVIVLLGNGSAGFGVPVALSVGQQPDAVAIGDFNHDGKTDLAVANQGSNDVSILLGHGDGSFAAQTRLTTGLQPRGLAVGDFNGDGRYDLAVACFGNNRVTILTGLAVSSGNLATDGQSLRTLNASPLNVAVGQGPQAIVTGNFNGDFDSNGKPRIDIAVANAGSNNVSVLLNLGAASFASQQTVTISSTLDPAAEPAGHRKRRLQRRRRGRFGRGQCPEPERFGADWDRRRQFQKARRRGSGNIEHGAAAGRFQRQWNDRYGRNGSGWQCVLAIRSAG